MKECDTLKIAVLLPLLMAKWNFQKSVQLLNSYSVNLFFLTKLSLVFKFRTIFQGKRISNKNIIFFFADC